jgi:hypothetical protein
MHKHRKSPQLARTVDGTLVLGKARRLTRASFEGTNSEMIADRTYALGG